MIFDVKKTSVSKKRTQYNHDNLEESKTVLLYQFFYNLIVVVFFYKTANYNRN